MSIDKSTALNIEMQADGGPVIAALTRVETKQKEVEEGQKRIARESKKSADEAVAGFRRMEQSAGGAAKGMGGLGDMLGTLGIGALGPAAAIAAAMQAARMQAQETAAIGTEGLKRQKNLAQIAFGAGEVEKTNEIRAGLEAARAGLPVSREASEAAYGGVRDVLPQTRFASTDTAMRLANAGISGFGPVYGDDPKAMRSQTAFGAQMFKFLQQTDPAMANSPGIENRVMSLAMKVQQDAGGTNPEEMLRSLSLMSVNKGGIDLLSLALATNQEAALRNQGPRMMQTMLKQFETAAAKTETVTGPGGVKSNRLAFPEFSRIVTGGDYAGALGYLLESPNLPPGLDRAVAGEQVVGLNLLRANAAGIRQQAGEFRKTFESGTFAREQAGLYGAAAPDVLEQRRQMSRQENILAGRETEAMQTARAVELVRTQTMGMGAPKFVADMMAGLVSLNQGIYDAAPPWVKWQLFPGGSPTGAIEIRTQDGIDAQGVE